MNERPEQPPEGRLLAAATERSGLSIREASRRAGLSYGRWRQITSGVQHVSPGNFAAVRAPARTLAKMAAAVGVTPEQMETEGQRPDVAGIMRAEPAPPQPPRRHATGIRVIDEAATDEEVAPFEWQVESEIARAEAKYGPEPTGEQIFGAGAEASAWNSPSVDRKATIRMIALFRLFAFQDRGGQSGAKTGLMLVAAAPAASP